MRQRWVIGLVLSLFMSAGAALSQPAFTGTKTVGTTPGVCAPTSAIVVPPGGNAVTYCYTITSLLGSDTSYSLVDDRLGLIVGNASLPAGATVQNIVNTFVNGSITNVANWSVPGQGGATATAQVSVGVDVPTMTDLGLVALGFALAAAGVVAMRARAT
jgi:hypothetical protein